MTWTTERPKAPGWYWYLCDGTPDPLIVFVDKQLSVEQGGWFVSELAGQFAGPLLPPGEKEE